MLNQVQHDNTYWTAPIGQSAIAQFTEVQISPETLFTHLSFTHFSLIMSVEDGLARTFYELEQSLMNHLEEFLMELGQGFCLEARQKRILVDDDYFFCDLVFYHRILKCHILIDLKASKIKYDDIAQMNLYLSYYKKNIMQKDDNPPVGILMCTQAGKELVEYTKEGIDENLFVKKYKLALPKEAELTKWLKNEVKNLGGSLNQ